MSKDEEEGHCDPGLDRLPVEVFKAADGDRSALIAYLRSDEPLSLYTRDALAAWLAGEIPPKRSRGHKHPSRLKRTISGLADPRPRALREYKRAMRAAKLGRKKSEEVAEEIALKYGIELERFINFIRRSKKDRMRASPPERSEIVDMYLEWLDFYR